MVPQFLLNIPSNQRRLFAQTSCLCMGIALVVWSLAPVVVNRLVSGDPPRGLELLSAGIALAVGCMFIGFQRLIRRGVRWGAWSAFALSLAIATAATIVNLSPVGSRAALFSLILAGITVFTTWLTLLDVREPNMAKR